MTKKVNKRWNEFVQTRTDYNSNTQFQCVASNLIHVSINHQQAQMKGRRSICWWKLDAPVSGVIWLNALKQFFLGLAANSRATAPFPLWCLFYQSVSDVGEHTHWDTHTFVSPFQMCWWFAHPSVRITFLQTKASGVPQRGKALLGLIKRTCFILLFLFPFAHLFLPVNISDSFRTFFFLSRSLFSQCFSLHPDGLGWCKYSDPSFPFHPDTPHLRRFITSLLCGCFTAWRGGTWRETRQKDPICEIISVGPLSDHTGPEKHCWVTAHSWTQPLQGRCAGFGN